MAWPHRVPLKGRRQATAGWRNASACFKADGTRPVGIETKSARTSQASTTRTKNLKTETASNVTAGPTNSQVAPARRPVSAQRIGRLIRNTRAEDCRPWHFSAGWSFEDAMATEVDLNEFSANAVPLRSLPPLLRNARPICNLEWLPPSGPATPEREPDP